MANVDEEVSASDTGENRLVSSDNRNNESSRPNSEEVDVSIFIQIKIKYMEEENICVIWNLM